MIDFFKNIFPILSSIDIETIVDKRILGRNYFKHKVLHDSLIKNGYLVLENVVSEDDILFLNNVYTELCTFSEYSINTKFQNSGRFQSPEIRKFVMDNIALFSKEFLPQIFDSNVFDENTTGAFQIKPPSKVSELNPHQDAPVIDETQENALFVWIPLCDVDEKNGAIYVLPRSHLWGNHQRSLNVPWVFEKKTKLLWQNMNPIYLKKGDIIVWDTALIHASAPNLSTDTRIAITTTLLPKNFTMIDYFKDGKTPKDKVEKYAVEKSFWENEDIMKRPPCPPNKFLGYESMVFPSAISTEDVLFLIALSKKNANV